MIRGICNHFVRASLGFLLGAGLFATSAQAAHVDPAPLPADIADRVTHSAPPDPLFQSLEHSLDEAVDLVKQIDTAQGLGTHTLSAGYAGQLAAKQNELNSYLTEIRSRLDQQAAKFAALGLADKTSDLRAQIEARFKRVTQALDRISQASDAAQRATAIRAARQVLRELYEVPKAAREPHTSPGAPTWKSEAPPPSREEPKSSKKPQYLSYEHAPSNNMYAFLGNTLLAAVTPTPPQAATCSYTAADLASTQDAPITPEIQKLAASLGYSPVKIFQYVSNNIKYEPYYGSLKGATGVLYTQAGGPTDQASFLVALLRASNIPARYVRGTVDVLDGSPAADGGRVARWLGAKSYTGAGEILLQGRMPTVLLLPNGLRMSHVWVEACVPYAHYRGASTDNAGFRWIPLDPSFKDKTYQAGIATNTNFNYAGFLSKRSDTLAQEWYSSQVATDIKALGPNYTNNTLADVPYKGAQVPLTVDVLPATLPYEVYAFNNWSNSGTPETADLPDTHRYKFNISVMNSSGAALAPAVTLSLPQTALNRVTLSFQGATAADVTALTSWQNDSSSTSAMPCTTNGTTSLNVVPVIKLEGVVQATGTTAVALCTYNNQLTMSVTLDEASTPTYPTINSVFYNNIGAGNYHALQAYSFQASDRLISERAKDLLNNVQNYPNPDLNLDGTEGEYLHVVGLKYVRYISDAAKAIGGLDGGSGESGNHLGLVSTAMKVQYVFDLPFAVDRTGLLVDFLGVRSRDVDLTSGSLVWKTFLLSGYAASNYESYMWQENAQRDAVSTVRGLQFANETGIPILNITAANASTQLPLLTNNSNPALNYSSTTVTNIQNDINSGYTFNIPRSLIQYNNWTGSVWEQEFNDPVAYIMSAKFMIAGSYAGGYSTYPLPTVSSTPSINTVFLVTDPGIPGLLVTTAAGLNNYVGSLTGANGLPQVSAGDPVNMVTGNFYHTERDLSIKGRGGLPLVFERNYNSRLPADGPLGFGWTHSFNHFLKFYGVENSLVKLSWVDGTGAEKFFSATPVSGGVGINTTLANAPGIFVTFQRLSDGTYTIREKNGLTYHFESNAGNTAGQSAKLLSIVDRNGNTLTLAYSGNNLATVTDGLGRQLTFTYSGSHLTQMHDWSGRSYLYGYDSNGNLTSFKNPLAVAGAQNPVSYSYYALADGTNLNHAMHTYTLPRGNGMSFEYYVNGRVFRHTTTLGETNTFTYNTYRRETVQTNERGQTRRFLFNQYGDLVQLTEETGAIRNYNYDTATPANIHNRLTKTDPEGYVTNYSYDSLGNVTSIVHPSGNTETLANFNSFNQPGTVKDANGNYTVLSYDAKGNLVQSLGLKAGVSTINTSNPNPALIVSWNINTYDSYGNLIVGQRMRDFVSRIGPTLNFDYTDTLNAVSGLNATKITRYGDKNGDGVIAANEFDVSPTLVYDSLGRMTQGMDRDWQATQIVYDSVDRVVQASDALGNLRDYQFDANGNPVAARLNLSVNGATTLVDSQAASFDQSDRKLSNVDAGGNVTAYQYDAAGNVTLITNPDNYTLGFVYDESNHLIQAFDQQSHSVSRTLDLEGKPRSITDPNGNTVNYVYYDSSKDGRLKQSIDAANHATTFNYDGNGNITSVTDNLGGVTLSFYDELNRPTRIVGPQYSDPTLGSIRPVTTFIYDNLGNRTAVASGYTTDTTGFGTTLDVRSTQLTVVYDDFGRRLRETDALGKFVSYQYDVNNNPIFITDAKSQMAQYTWGYGHQLISIKDAANNLISYTRNSLGQATAAQSPAVSYSYGYDASHRLTSITDFRANKSLSYRYSPGGLLNTMVDSDGNETDYLYDPVGRLAGIWAPNYDYVSFAYDAGGRLTEKWFPNGVDTQLSWNSDNTLSSLTNLVGATVLSSHNYTYDGVGNRQTNTETVNATTINYIYTYDALNRLTQVSNGIAANQENYGYDPLGNRTTKTTNATTPNTIAYVYDAANQLNEIHQTNTAGALLSAFVYDANGSMTAKCEGAGVTTIGTACSGATTTSLTYDALNRMVQAIKTGIPTQSYAYDDQGRRIQKTVGGIASNFLYSGPDIVAEYGSGWGLAVAQYTHGPNQDEPIERITATTAQYFHHDGLGSIVAVTNNLGGTDATQSFDAWGNQLTTTGTSPRYGYTGREPDETGLMYYRARYYDPTIGRFAQRDPIGLNGGLNLYAYVNGNPINFTDPYGLIDWSNAGKAAIGILGNAAGIFTGGVLTVGGGALVLAPEPTMLTKVGGVAAVAAGVANIANSSAGLVNSTRNLINAIQDNSTQYPSSGTGVIAAKYFPGNQTAARASMVTDLVLAFGSGRVPVGLVADESTMFSVLANTKPASINGLLDARAASVPSSLSGILTPVENGASAASRSLDYTQIGVTASTVDAAYSTPNGSGGSGNQTMSGVSPH